MAQLERPQRQSDSPKNQAESIKSPSIQTMEQLLRAGEASKSRHSPTYTSPSSSSSSSPFFQRFRHHDTEEDNGQNQKKSVLTKVKEKAKKLRHSLSKRRHDDGSATSPSSGASLEGDGAEEDAEFLGAPVYESEKAGPGFKENTKQNLRISPKSPEKRVISNYEKSIAEHDQEKMLTRSLSKKTTSSGLRFVDPPLTKSQSARAALTTTTTTATTSNPNKAIAKNVTEKLTPAYGEGSEHIKSVTSKVQGLTLSKPTEHHPSSSSSTTAKTGLSLSYTAPRTPPAKLPSQTCSTTPRNSSAPTIPSPSSAPPLGKISTSPTSQIWDKGVSVKEYLMNKLEPGEDEKALSQVISEAMSPRRTPGDAGVIEKVREAVTSLLRNEEPAKYADTSSPTANVQPQMPGSENVSRNSSEISLETKAQEAKVSRTSSEIPVSTNAQEVVQEEENHGRVLQAN